MIDGHDRIWTWPLAPLTDAGYSVMRCLRVTKGLSFCRYQKARDVASQVRWLPGMLEKRVQASKVKALQVR